MSSITLTWKGSNEPALSDGSLLRPDTLCTLDAPSLAAVKLPIGRTSVPLGEFFEVHQADSSDIALIIRGAPPLNRLGANMSQGTLIIEGDVGDDLGASMTGGLIGVTGNAGHRVGGPDYSSKRGMTGGEILIDGTARDFVGFLMRRGLIAIAGTTGKSPGYRMLAGTIVLGSRCEDQPGLEMQRGTIIALDTVKVPVSFSESGIISATAMPAMMLVMKRLRDSGWKPGDDSRFDWNRMSDGAWRLWSGDGLAINKGEVLQWLS